MRSLIYIPILIIALLLSACETDRTDVATDDPTVVTPEPRTNDIDRHDRLSVADLSDYIEEGNLRVTGDVENTSGAPVRGVTVSIDFLDHEGQLIEQVTQSYDEELAAGESWTFDVGAPIGATDWRFGEITADNR